MTIDEALNEAILGSRVRAKGMQPGSYIDYHFNGWRINFPSGSSSDFVTQKETYADDEWEVIGEEPKPTLDSWGRPVIVGADWGAKPAIVFESNPGDPAWVRNKWGQPK